APLPPAAPGSPVAPCGPAGPVAPGSPLAPVSPLGPAGPAGPVSPLGPAGPVSPLAALASIPASIRFMSAAASGSPFFQSVLAVNAISIYLEIHTCIKSGGYAYASVIGYAPTIYPPMAQRRY